MYRFKGTTDTEVENLLLFKQGVILIFRSPGVPLSFWELVLKAVMAWKYISISVKQENFVSQKCYKFRVKTVLP